MRSAKNLRPEWGYGPARRIDFMRAVGIFMVATTIGATAGGGVVFSLVDVSTSEASVGPQALAAPVQALISAPEAAQPNPKPIVEPTIDSGGNGGIGATTSESSTDTKVVAPADIAPRTAVGPSDGSVKVASPPSAAAAPAEDKTIRKRHVANRYVQPDRPFGFGQGAQYPNRAFGGSYRDGRWGGSYQNGASRYHAWDYGRE